MPSSLGDVIQSILHDTDHTLMEDLTRYRNIQSIRIPLNEYHIHDFIAVWKENRFHSLPKQLLPLLTALQDFEQLIKNHDIDYIILYHSSSPSSSHIQSRPPGDQLDVNRACIHIIVHCSGIGVFDRTSGEYFPQLTDTFQYNNLISCALNYAHRYFSCILLPNKVSFFKEISFAFNQARLLSYGMHWKWPFFGWKSMMIDENELTFPHSLSPPFHLPLPPSHSSPPPPTQKTSHPI